ncbi:hypothetical protein [Ideonella sp.]|uniref:hypothetical protein n=1 Tax=Ideonella sp. TaxID=1929293 RepID=UPI002B49222E|nr:hypothetical protein [Ideonella sp.]HJV69822.1 hypothetical protein [Ideonella sp.]
MYRPLYVPQAARGPVPWRPAAAQHPARRLAARQLRRAGAWLAWAARQLAAPAARPAEPGPLPEVEYCAEAGAPEGALFVNGEYVGRLDVGRL